MARPVERGVCRKNEKDIAGVNAGDRMIFAKKTRKKVQSPQLVIFN